MLFSKKSKVSCRRYGEMAESWKVGGFRPVGGESGGDVAPWVVGDLFLGPEGLRQGLHCCGGRRGLGARGGRRERRGGGGGGHSGGVIGTQYGRIAGLHISKDQDIKLIMFIFAMLNCSRIN